jgi:hypothetical protein
MAASEETLGALHEAVASNLLKKVLDGTATAPEISAAIKLLKDSDIQALPTPSNHPYPNAVPSHDPMVHDLHTRVSRIEEGARHTQTELAVIKNDMSYVKDSVGGILSGINKILWAIGLSVLGVFMTFILSGGLTIIQN